jgi:hypothetical protein
VIFIQPQQPPGQFFAHLTGSAVAVKPP